MIDPKVSMAINILVAIVGALAAMTPTMFPSYVPSEIAKDIIQTAGFISVLYGAVNAALHGVSSPTKGPLVSDPNKLNSPLIVGAAALLLALAMFPGVSHAQERKKSLFPAWDQAINADMLADINASKALADAQGDTIASACYGELSKEMTAIQAVQQKSLPKVHLFWDFQHARGLYQATKSDSKLSIACAPLAQQIKMDVLGFVNMAISGGFTIAKVGPLFGLP